MNDLAPVAIEFDPQKEFIVDREAIRLLRAGEPVKSIAEKLGLSQMTIRRRMGAVLIRLLTEIARYGTAGKCCRSAAARGTEKKD